MKTAAHRILLVDDDFDEQFLTQRALRKCIGHRGSVHVVNSGNEAIAYMIGEGKYADRTRFPFPTTVITDLNMEDGDGFDVLEFMQANPGWSVIPRIVFSSSDEDDDVRTSYLLGASAYQVKPTAPAELEAKMHRLFDFWADIEAPPVDKTGRLLTTDSIGRRGARYPQPPAGGQMKRPPPH